MERRRDGRNEPQTGRRRYLVRTAGAIGAVGTLGSLAGCLGNGADGTDSGSTSPDGDEETSGDGGSDGGGDGAGGDGGGEGNGGDSGGDGDGSAATLESHASTAGIDDEPALGPPLESATAVVVAFSDPSCPTCRRFETGTFPALKTDYVETGELAFVYRVMPITYPWGKPAVQALEATYDRDSDAFWALKDHYYAEQGSFSRDNVLELTGEFLAANTGVDAEAVVADAESKAFDARVQEDLEAGLAADVAATPTFYLFRDGAFRTQVSGAKDVSVFAAALGL